MPSDTLRAEALIAQLHRLRDRSVAGAREIERRLANPTSIDPKGALAHALTGQRRYTELRDARPPEAARARRAIILHSMALVVVVAACAWLVTSARGTS